MRVPDRFRVGITRYQAGDAAELTAWWLKTFGPARLNPGRNAWLHERNPCIGANGPGPWICRRDGDIVGQQGEVPFELQVGSELRPAIWAVDLVVDPAWRLRGVGPALIATLLEHNSIACMLDLTDEGYAAFSGAGCVDLGVLPTYRRPLDPRRALQMPGVPAPLRRLAPVAAPALRLVDALAGAAIRLTGAKLVPVQRFDERVDEVWATASRHYPVLARRDLAALSWRIDQRPNRDHLQRYYLVRRGHTIGYVVLRRTVSSGESATVVVDYLAPPRWVAPLLLAVGRTARREGAVALSIKSRNPQADRLLRITGFVRRRLDHDADRRIMLHCTEGPEVAALLHDPDAWLFTSTDSNLESAGSESVPQETDERGELGGPEFSRA